MIQSGFMLFPVGGGGGSGGGQDELGGMGRSNGERSKQMRGKECDSSPHSAHLEVANMAFKFSSWIYTLLCILRATLLVYRCDKNRGGGSGVASTVMFPISNICRTGCLHLLFLSSHVY